MNNHQHDKTASNGITNIISPTPYAAGMHMGPLQDLTAKLGVLFDAGEYSNALAVCNDILQIAPHDIYGLSSRVFSLRQLHKFVDTEKAGREALQIYPNDLYLLNQLAFISYDQGDWKKALEGFQETLKADPKNEKALEFTVVCHRLLRDFGAAKTEADKALAKLPGSPALLNELAFISYDQGDWKKALEGLQETLKADPKNEKALEFTVVCHRLLRDFGAAKTEADKALAKLPGSPALLNQLAFISYDQGDWKKALEGLQETLKADSKNEMANAYQITCYKRLGDAEGIKGVLQSAAKALPNSAMVHYSCGLAYLDDRNLSDAEKAFNSAVTLSPDWSEPFFKLADVLTRSGRQSEAFTRIEKLKEKFPTDPRIREGLGFMYIEAKDFTSARHEFNAILSVDAENERGKNGLGVVMFHSGRFGEAVDIFEDLARRNPHQLVFQSNQARALSRMGKEEDLRKAKIICEKVLRIERVNSQALACLGVLHYRLGSWNESEENLRRAIDLSPADGPYRDLGALYTKQGRYNEAEDQLKIAVQINKHDSRAYIELGSLYFEMDRKSDALRTLRRAVATDRNSPEAIEALAKGLIQAKELQEAEQQLRNGIKRLNPRDCFGLHLSLARVLFQLGSKANDVILLEEALQQATKAVKLEPQNPDGYFELGMAHNALNSPSRALRAFKECQELAPDHLEAQRNIERLKKLLSMERTVRRSDVAGMAISALSLILLLALWGFYLLQPAGAVEDKKPVSHENLSIANAASVQGKPKEVIAKEPSSKPQSQSQPEARIDRSMILTLTPMLLGLIVIGAVLPWVGRLKFAGMEAELQQARVTIGAGPSGQTGSGTPDAAATLSTSGGNSIDTGPR